VTACNEQEEEERGEKVCCGNDGGGEAGTMFGRAGFPGLGLRQNRPLEMVGEGKLHARHLRCCGATLAYMPQLS